MTDRDIVERPSSQKFVAFVEALESLCRKHGVFLCGSGYEGLQVWDIDDDEPLTAAGIDDCTRPTSATP